MPVLADNYNNQCDDIRLITDQIHSTFEATGILTAVIHRREVVVVESETSLNRRCTQILPDNLIRNSPNIPLRWNLFRHVSFSWGSFSDCFDRSGVLAFWQIRVEVCETSPIIDFVRALNSLIFYLKLKI